MTIAVGDHLILDRYVVATDFGSEGHVEFEVVRVDYVYEPLPNGGEYEYVVNVKLRVVR